MLKRADTCAVTVYAAGDDSLRHATPRRAQSSPCIDYYVREHSILELAWMPSTSGWVSSHRRTPSSQETRRESRHRHVTRTILTSQGHVAVNCPLSSPSSLSQGHNAARSHSGEPLGCRWMEVSGGSGSRSASGWELDSVSADQRGRSTPATRLVTLDPIHPLHLLCYIKSISVTR